MAKSTKPRSPRESKSQAPSDRTEKPEDDNASPVKSRPAGVKFAPAEQRSLYAAAKFLPLPVRQKCGLQITLEVYLQDPLLAKTDPDAAFDAGFEVNWEPSLTTGPTSARFAVVDYNGDSAHLAPPAEWNEKSQRFVFDGQALDKTCVDKPQFHQVSVWALAQRALAFFEEGNGLGRRIPWGFEGNRLIIVPHAGYGENAFYDRQSKSLQFYYFGSDESPVYTCLSTDIVCHEFGHAILDGIRPYFNESSSVQTGAFHEAIGDLTAILMSFRSNAFRRWLAEKTAGNLSMANPLAFIAEEFGKEVQNKPYLRSALNEDRMSDPHVASSNSAHRVSGVLVGAIYEIMIRLSENYNKTPNRSVPQKFWDLASRIQRMAVQPLDLLPPVDVTFRDYALAVIRAEQIANPLDPKGYRKMLIEVFRKREILKPEDEESLNKQEYLFDRIRLSVLHAIDDISRSRAAAYRFLDDNRQDLFIPPLQDFVIADLYDAHKLTRQAARLPRQVVIEYVWREDVPLNGPQFGHFDGQLTSMLCGGTLVFDESGNVLSWARKPGTYGKDDKHWADEAKAGEQRRKEFLDGIIRQVAAGRVGVISGSERGLLGTRVPPIIAEDENDTVHFHLSPHLNVSEHDHEDDESGERQWQISC